MTGANVVLQMVQIGSGSFSELIHDSSREMNLTPFWAPKINLIRFALF
jgi:hypothetical protein